MQNRTRNQPEHTQTKSAVSLFYLTVTLSFSNFSSLLLLFFACYRSLRLTDLHNSSSFHLLTSQSHPIPTQPIFLSFPYCLLGSCIVTMELETVFDRADVTINSTLDPLQLQDFYNKMKDVVWVLTCTFKFKGTRDMSRFSGTGFCINREGLIMTVAHIFEPPERDCIRVIEARRLDDNGLKFKVDIEFIESRWDLALLKVLNVFDCRFGKLAIDGSIFVGQNLLCIGHPSYFIGSLMVGRAVFQCVDDVIIPADEQTCGTYRSTALEITPEYRCLGDIYDAQTSSLASFAGRRHPLVPIVQVSGLGAGGGSSGGPLFNTRGEIVGVHAQGSDGYSTAIHVSLVKKFLENSESDGRKSKSREKVGSSKKLKGKETQTLHLV